MALLLVRASHALLAAPAIDLSRRKDLRETLKRHSRRLTRDASCAARTPSAQVACQRL
jgi:hypothetical protein